MRTVLVLLVALTAFAFSHSVVLTLDAPDTGVTGLAWGNGSLWALSANTDFVHEVDPSNGDILSSFYFDYTETLTPTGLGFCETYDRVLCGGWQGTNGYIYQYSPDGTYISKHSMCGG